MGGEQNDVFRALRENIDGILPSLSFSSLGLVLQPQNLIVLPFLLGNLLDPLIHGTPFGDQRDIQIPPAVPQLISLL